MSNLNKVEMTGEISFLPDLRTTAKGTTYGNLGIKQRKLVKSKDGSAPREVFSYFTFRVWDKIASECAKLEVGDTIRLVGHLETYSQTDSEGKRKFVLSVVLDNYESPYTGGELEPRDSGKEPGASAPKQESSYDDYLDEDLPF